MASIVLSSVGQSVGDMILPGVGGRALGFLGGKAGKYVDQEMGLTNVANDGAQLDGFSVQDSKYGLSIPVIYGRARVAGNIIWASDLIESEHQESAYGKGGGVISSSSKNYSYSIHCAIALGEGEIGGIQTIWADSKVIYQNGAWKTGIVGSATIYNGAADQDVDPLLESWIGAGEVPAYRGMAYIVFESLQLSNFGNRLPNLSFEVLPKDATGTPEWLGYIDPALSISGYTNLQAGASPIIIEGWNISARRILTCGYNFENDEGWFVVCEVDVVGDAPIELARVESDVCAMQGVASHHWALSPDNRFVSIGFQDSSAARAYYVMIYDTKHRVFGPAIRIDMEYLDYREMVWIDQQRVAFTETIGDVRGLRILMRSGMSVTDLGFYDVWGLGSKYGRRVLGYAQFVPCKDGYLHITANASPNFSTLYAVHIAWVNNDLVMGKPYVLSSNISLGSGSGPFNFVLKTGAYEYSFVHTSVMDVSLMSFVPGKETSQIIRNWQTIGTSDTYGLATMQAPVAFGNRVLFVQKSAYENAYRLSEVLLCDSDFVLELDHKLIENAETGLAHFSVFYLGANRLMIQAHTNFGSWAHQAIVKRQDTGDALDKIVADLLIRAGYESSDFNVSALADISVDGFVVARQSSAASSLALLQLFEPFDLVENDGQLCAYKRIANSAVTIDSDELGADEVRKDIKFSVPSLAVTRMQELDLPVELTVDAIDASRDYEIGSQRARRLSAKGGPRATKLTLPIVCTATKMKRIAERALYNFWSERASYRFSVSHRWLRLTPADVVEIDGHKIRINEIIYKNGVMAVAGVSAKGNIFSSESDAESGGDITYSKLDTVPSVLHLMDMPLLRNEDNQAGVYVAVTGREGWSGAGLWRSADGINYTEKASFEKPAISGTAVTALGLGPVCYCDNASVVQVQLYQGTLSSCTIEELLNGVNVALLGGEIIQFKFAVLIGPGLYELSGLLRGKQGTEDHLITHRVGEAFVLLSAESVQFLPALLFERNQQFLFRAVSYGRTLGTASTLSLTYNMNSLKPLAPVHLKLRRVAGVGSDCTISWIRRARMNAAWVDYIDVPFDEAQELYDIEVMDDGSVVRLFENISTCELVYTAAEQSADWPMGAPDNYSVNVYQRSNCYGRGQKARAVLGG